MLIDLQVLRGTTSHFNGATALDATLFEVMGGLIAVVFLAGVVAAVLVVRQGDLPPVLGAGIRGGVIVSVLGMAQAGGVPSTVIFGSPISSGYTPCRRCR